MDSRYGRVGNRLTRKEMLAGVGATAAAAAMPRAASAQSVASIAKMLGVGEPYRSSPAGRGRRQETPWKLAVEPLHLIASPPRTVGVEV